MAGPADDGPLGHRRPGRRGGGAEALSGRSPRFSCSCAKRISCLLACRWKLEGQALKRELDQIGKTALQPEA